MATLLEPHQHEPAHDLDPSPIVEQPAIESDNNPVHRLPVGTAVEVLGTFDKHWCRGFEIADVVDDGYRVRRLSDGATLPRTFATGDVRTARPQATRWR